LRQLRLAKTGLNKIKSQQWELKSGDVEDSIRSMTPGEWCWLQHPQGNEVFVAFVNPLIEERFSCIQAVHSVAAGSEMAFEVEKFIAHSLKQAYLKRMVFKDYEQGARIFYGAKDGLPGLIIDLFCQVAVIQINTAGIDRYRTFIGTEIEQLTGKKAHYLDNLVYRQKESLPVFESQALNQPLKILENSLHYEIRPDVIQKVGFYYDHRENRLQLKHLLSRQATLPREGLDLFCYVGAWGLNALSAGVQQMSFVDQGDFQHEVDQALGLNGFSQQGKFQRMDVFKFLDQAAGSSKKFDLILCDPPAFAKSLSQKAQALEGYSKLHRKVIKVSAPAAIIAFSSCTHYVSHEEFQKNIADAAAKEGRKIQLLFTGMQGWDHPVQSLHDKANYIKCYIYRLE
jgi:23S rRNA (cytosine1962-C5)-methyltransferase